MLEHIIQNVGNLDDLQELEREWIRRLLKAKVKGIEYLEKQMTCAKIIRKREYAYISLLFVLETTVEAYPYAVSVPIIMYAYQENTVPIVFALHLRKGIISEVEIFTADSTQIFPETIRVDNVEYMVGEECKCDLQDVIE